VSESQQTFQHRGRHIPRFVKPESLHLQPMRTNSAIVSGRAAEENSNGNLI
jgi:hypothetical protein